MQGCIIITSVLLLLPWQCAVQGTPDEQQEYTWGDHGDERNPSDGTYSFYYEVPGHSSRAEERDYSSEEDSIEVEGYYSFVSPEGEEFEFKYEAGVDGFIVESDALPEPPEDTDEVKQAKKEFFETYCKALGMEADCDIFEHENEIESDDEESSEEDSSEEDSSSEEEDEEIGFKRGGNRFKRKSIKSESFNKRHNLSGSLRGRYTAGIVDQKQKLAGGKLQRQIDSIQKYIGNTLPSHSRTQNLNNTRSQNLFEKPKELSINRNRELFDNTASTQNSNQGRPGSLSSYQTSHRLQNLNQKPNDHYSLQLSHNPEKSQMRQTVPDTLFHKRQNLKSSLPIHNNKELHILKRQGQSKLIKKIPYIRTDLKSLIYQDNRNIVDSIKNLYKKGEDNEKSKSNSSINLKSSLANHSIKSVNKQRDQKASLRLKPILKDTNQRIQNIKGERSHFERKQRYGLERKQKGKSTGNVNEEPGLHYRYSVSYGDK